MESKSVLIITVVDKGNVDLVMDAARSAGASGGTVVKAKGTGAEMAKFFGVSISEEKEMVYIIAPRTDRDAIMQAIMEKAGAKTEATETISENKLNEIVSTILSLNDFETQNVTMISGITNGEQGNKEAYFNGVKVECHKKESKKTL